MIPAILDVNTLLSDVTAQIPRLKCAGSISTGVKYKRSGQSFYPGGGEGSTFIEQEFPGSLECCIAAGSRIDSIRTYIANAKNAAQLNSVKSPAPGRLLWDNSTPAHISAEDVITFHSCFNYSEYEDAVESIKDDHYVTIDDLPGWLNQTCKRWKKTKALDVSFAPLIIKPG